MKNVKQYAILNKKDLTVREYFIATDDFGQPYVKYSRDIIDYGHCKKYVNPLVIFIREASVYMNDEHNDLCTYIESGKYEDMIEDYKRMF
jgi:hypothetical protein